MKIKPGFWILFLLLSGITGCTKDVRDPCLQPQTTAVLVHCVRHFDTSATLIDTALPNPVLHPLSSQPQQFYYGGVKRLVNFRLSLSNATDSSRWILRPDSANAMQDTLSFYYQRQLHFLSNACGYTYFYHLDSIQSTRNAIDSIRLEAADVTNDANVEHLKIIFK
ncbi:MAG: hypothetical protein JST36_01525 [Bacteroidetes bacterium]|nr:hypothetical protein [Bacteroidota bacterium]